MTQEEKAKAYDEALKQAKFYHGNCPSEPERKKLEKMFPVLHESEDERARKSLIKFLTEIKEISESGRTTWAIRKEDAEMCKSFLAWLEKQKEKLGDISTILLVKKEIERRIETWQKSRKELIAMECNTLADDAAVRIEELYSLISFLGTIRCNTNEKQKEQKPNCKYKCPLTDEQLMATDFWKVYLKESLIPGAKPNKQDIEFLLPTARNYFSLIMKEVCTICKDWSNGYREGLESGEQKSIERSEEDEKTINDACCWIAEYAGYLMDKNYGKASMLMCLTEKLKSLHTQSKFECSGATINGEPIPTENQSVNIPLAEWNEDYDEDNLQTRFAFYTYKDEPSVLYLSNVFVEKTCRTSGYGTRILKAAEKVAEVVGATTIRLKVKQESLANAWYRKNGYSFMTFEDGYNWLEKNVERMKPNKQEWSEEDERMQKEVEKMIVLFT